MYRMPAGLCSRSPITLGWHLPEPGQCLLVLPRSHPLPPLHQPSHGPHHKDSARSCYHSRLIESASTLPAKAAARAQRRAIPAAGAQGRRSAAPASPRLGPSLRRAAKRSARRPRQTARTARRGRRLTVRLLEASAGAATSELLGLGAAGVGDQQGAVKLQERLPDLRGWSVCGAARRGGGVGGGVRAGGVAALLRGPGKSGSPEGGGVCTGTR